MSFYTRNGSQLLSAFNGGSVGNPYLAPDGTTSAPGYGFTTDSTIGLYKVGTGVLGLLGSVRIGTTTNGGRLRGGATDTINIDSASGSANAGSLLGTNFSSGTTVQLNAFGVNVFNGGFFGYSSTAAHSGTVDVVTYRAAASEFSVGNGSPVTGSIRMNTAQTVKGQALTITSKVTASGALSGATVTLTGAIPAGCLLLGVTARVTTTITGATSWDLGISGGDTDLFANDEALAAGTTTDISDYTAQPDCYYMAATDLLLTANGSNFTGGVVSVTVHYIDLTPATSN